MSLPRTGRARSSWPGRQGDAEPGGLGAGRSSELLGIAVERFHPRKPEIAESVLVERLGENIAHRQVAGAYQPAQQAPGPLNRRFAGGGRRRSGRPHAIAWGLQSC